MREALKAKFAYARQKVARSAILSSGGSDLEERRRWCTSFPIPQQAPELHWAHEVHHARFGDEL